MGSFFLTLLIAIAILFSLFFIMSLVRKIGRYNIKIIPFTGFGTRHSFTLLGRVIVDKGDFISYAIKEFTGKKFIRNYRRVMAIKIPNVILEVNFGFKKHITKTDEKGYYKLMLNLNKKDEFPIGVNKYSIKVLDEKFIGDEAFGDLVVMPDKVKYGVICDIDDTILQSGVQKKIRLVLKTFMSNERDMKPIPGMNILLNDLHIGINKTSQNPILYVTASPYDLFDKIASFMKTNYFPLGPQLMKKLRGDDRDKLFDNYNYKLKTINEVFEKFPNMKFILIGDNTESDVEVFNRIDKERPGRVLSIIIMNVRNEKKDPTIYRKAILCNTSFDAALDFVKNNIMSPDAAYELGLKLKDLHILSPDYKIDEKINTYLPFPIKEFRKFLKKKKKILDKKKKILDNIKNDNEYFYY